MESNLQRSTDTFNPAACCRKLGAFGVARCLRILSQLSQKVDLTPLVSAVQNKEAQTAESIQSISKMLMELLADDTLDLVKSLLKEIADIDDEGIEKLSPSELVEVLRYSWELNQLEKEFELVKKTLSPILEK